MLEAARRIATRLAWGLVPAVPVPFRGGAVAAEAQRGYAEWMATHPVAGVAGWAHTGRGRLLSVADRATVLATWRTALPDRLVIAGADSPTMAEQARHGGADAVLAFPQADDPVGYHAALGGELPVLAFYLYDAAGGVPYDDATLRRILALPCVAGIKVATLDSPATFRRIAAVAREFSDRVLVTGEDRFFGQSLDLGARAALVGMGAALPDRQVALLRAHRDGRRDVMAPLTALLDRLGALAFATPIEGYVRRMLWAAAAEGAVPGDSCDDPWGPPLDPAERETIASFVRAVRDGAS
jgi:4-hydroxy-tetrahydrodipicolinate synthase